MRIVFLGNMNNLTFYTAQELKKRGLDITFIVDADKNNLLDRPESWDKNLLSGYPEWIKEMILPDKLKAFKFAFPLLYFKKYIQFINQYDVIFLNSFWISLAKYVKPGKKVVAIFAGYDLDVLADFKSVDVLTESFYNSSSIIAKIIPRGVLQLLFKKIVDNQRNGIRYIDTLNYYATGINPKADKLLNQIKGEQKYTRIEYRGLDCAKFNYATVSTTKTKFTILNITRFFYLNERNDNKRNDIMIRGIGLFLKNHQVTPEDVEILFFEKGNDLEAAKALCKECGLDPFIKWQQQIAAEDLNDFFAGCDVAFDQLGNHWVGAGFFSMLTGRPLIANGRPEILDPLFKEESPVCQATSEEDVAMWLSKLYTQRHLVKEIGMASREYVLRNFSINNTTNYFIEHLSLK